MELCGVHRKKDKGELGEKGFLRRPFPVSGSGERTGAARPGRVSGEFGKRRIFAGIGRKLRKVERKTLLFPSLFEAHTRSKKTT